MLRIGKVEIVISDRYANRLFGADVGRAYHQRELIRIELGIGFKTRIVVRWEPKITLEDWRPSEHAMAYASRLANKYGSSWMQHAKPKPGDVEKLAAALKEMGVQAKIEEPTS